MPHGSLAPRQRKGGRARRSLRVAVALFLLVLLLAVAGAIYQAVATALDARRYPPPGRLVDVGGQRLHLNCTGAGDPTVIFVSGASSNSLSWILVQPAVARLTRACSYDRAGLGWSDPRRTPNTARQNARELRTLLANAGIRGPYLLVGHSFGGFVARVFANDYPGDVSGMVLVDSSHPDQDSRPPEQKRADQEQAARYARYLPILARTGVIRLAMSLGFSLLERCPPCRRGQAAAFYEALKKWPPDARQKLLALWSKPAYLAATYTVWVLFEESADQVRGTSKLVARPLVVLRRGREAKEDWVKLQADLAGLSTNSKQVVASRSGHYIPLDQPEAVISAVRQVVEAVRSGRRLEAME